MCQGFREVEALSQVFDLQPCLLLGGQRALHALSILPQLLQGLLVPGDAGDAPLRYHLGEILHDTLVKILVALVRGVASGGVDLKDAAVDDEEGNIQGVTTQVKHKDVGLTSSFFHTVGSDGVGGLINEELHIEALPARDRVEPILPRHNPESTLHCHGPHPPSTTMNRSPPATPRSGAHPPLQRHNAHTPLLPINLSSRLVLSHAILTPDCPLKQLLISVLSLHG